MKPLIAISAGLLHAALMMLAFPPVGFWPAALVAIIPLVWAAAQVERSARLGESGTSVRTALKPALWLSLGVLPFYIIQQHWLINVTAVGYVPAAVWMVLFPGAFVWLTVQLRVRLPVVRTQGGQSAGPAPLPLTLLIPIIWTALEVFRGEVAFSGYPWFLIAHPLIDAPLLPLPATVLGTYFVSFLTAMIAGIVGDLILARSRQDPAGQRASRHAALAGIAGFVIITGASPLALRTGVDTASSLRIAVIQTNVPQDNKLVWTVEQKIQDYERFLELTTIAATAEPGPDLIIWPETMFPDLIDPHAVEELRREQILYRVDPRIRPVGYIFATEFHDRLVELHQHTGVPMLIGAGGADNVQIEARPDGTITFDADAHFNSVFLLEEGRVDPRRYDKLVLTPFGEIMPYIHHLPWLERQLLAIGAHGMRFDLSAGSEPYVFQINGADGRSIAIATPICFEVTKPRLTRLLLRQVEPGQPRFLVNVTNDGWFAHYDGGRQQHLQISRWRSLELGTPMLRAANTGISAWIDKRGRIVQAGTDDGHRSRNDGILTADLRPTTNGTIYARIGEVFGWSILALGGGMVLIAFARRRGTSRG